MTAEVKKTGPVTGSEVVQVYAGYTGASSDRPNEELCGFAKIELQPGDTGRVEIPVDQRALE